MRHGRGHGKREAGNRNGWESVGRPEGKSQFLAVLSSQENPRARDGALASSPATARAQLQFIPPVRLDPLPAPHRNQRRSQHRAVHLELPKPPRDDEPRRPSLIAHPHLKGNTGAMRCNYDSPSCFQLISVSVLSAQCSDVLNLSTENFPRPSSTPATAGHDRPARRQSPRGGKMRAFFIRDCSLGIDSERKPAKISP